MTIGFIGLGAMGLPMAQNVMRAGHNLRIIQHRRNEPVVDLQGRGAVVCSTPAEVAAGADAVITVLPADTQLDAVIGGEYGLASALEEGQVLIDLTTARPDTLKKYLAAFSERKVSVIDAPVSGGITGAAEGTLTIMVGADTHVFEEWRPLLESMGKDIYHVGEVGQGKIFKIVNQLMAAVHLLVIGEAFGLGSHLGADVQTLRTVIAASSGYSRMMDLRLEGYLFDGVFEPGFALDLMKKDLRLAVESAHEAGLASPLAAYAHELFQTASVAGHGKADFSKAAAVLAQSCGSQFGGR